MTLKFISVLNLYCSIPIMVMVFLTLYPVDTLYIFDFITICLYNISSSVIWNLVCIIKSKFILLWDINPVCEHYSISKLKKWWNLLTTMINLMQQVMYLSRKQIMIYLNFFSHWTPIQIEPNQKLTINHYQDPFEFNFPRMQLFIYIRNQNHMENLSLTSILTIYLTFLLLLYFPLFLDLENLYPRVNTLWFHFALVKGKPSQNSTLDFFKQKAIFLCLMMKQDKQTTSEVNTS